MRKICIELLHYITEAIDNGLSDKEISDRIEEVAWNEEITSEEYCQIYELAIGCYRKKFIPQPIY